MGRFSGKYKAYVADINDPLNMGRIRVSCPAVTLNYLTGWCDPCFPCDGDYYVPTVGSCVWIEFQQGDLDKPIWLGGWYAENQAPANMTTRVISYGGATITLSGGSVLINGTDVISKINSLEDQIEALERKVAALG